MIDIVEIKREILKKKTLNEMSKSEMIRFIDDRRRPFITDEEYKILNIPSYYTRLDLHNSFELMLLMGVSNGEIEFTSNELSNMDYLLIQLEIYYKYIIQSYDKNEKKEEIVLNILLYLNILKKIENLIKEKRNKVNKVNFVSRKKDLPNYLYPLKKIYQENYNINEFKSIGHFSIFLANIVQEVKFYNLKLLKDEIISLNIILEASQNIKYKSLTKKALSSRFYEFLCNVSELKNIPKGDDLIKKYFLLNS